MMNSTTSGTEATYDFSPTQDQYSSNIPVWKDYFAFVSAREPRILEIGSWEGRSAVFLLTTLCATGGEAVCVDHFDAMQTPAGRERYRRVMHNLRLTGRPARVLAQFSVPALFMLLQEEGAEGDKGGFDWIYINRVNRADDACLNAELAWRLARPGCIFIFDDFHCSKYPIEHQHHPRRGMEAFLTLHASEYNRLTDEKHRQVVLQKTSAMRNSFSPLGRDRVDGMDDDLRVVVSIDSEFAMPAAVMLRSLVEATPGPLTIYILEWRLSQEAREKLVASIPIKQNVALRFQPLSPDSLAAKMGLMWAKIDLMKNLPFDRVLYMDADALVRKDLRELWRIELDGRPLAAVQDAGYPMGHDGVPRAAYFNSGVMLLDLVRIKTEVPELEKRAPERKQSLLRDQDLLNAHFTGNWVPLSPRWNAHGLVSGADRGSPEQRALRWEDVKDPAIVHFTGAVHPSLPEVLNPWVQPHTAKPWGYAGAPGHPFTDEWWQMLEKTAWKGWQTTPEYLEICEREIRIAQQKATEALERRLRECCPAYVCRR
ncbi:hypothetical protein ID866_4638 [Astraeus odoratus]|nr:hypothetical protein ID866_4638 [Astraeus odoratus]